MELESYCNTLVRDERFKKIIQGLEDELVVNWMYSEVTNHREREKIYDMVQALHKLAGRIETFGNNYTETLNAD